jgi:hypothetical protein
MLSDDPMGSSLLVKQAAAPFTIGVQSSTILVKQAAVPFTIGVPAPTILFKQASAPFTIGVQTQLSTRDRSLVEAVRWKQVQASGLWSKGQRWVDADADDFAVQLRNAKVHVVEVSENRVEVQAGVAEFERTVRPILASAGVSHDGPLVCVNSLDTLSAQLLLETVRASAPPVVNTAVTRQARDTVGEGNFRSVAIGRGFTSRPGNLPGASGFVLPSGAVSSVDTVIFDHPLAAPLPIGDHVDCPQVLLCTRFVTACLFSFCFPVYATVTLFLALTVYFRARLVGCALDSKVSMFWNHVSVFSSVLLNVKFAL